MKNDFLQRLKYGIGDALAAAISYTLLYTFRKQFIEKGILDQGEIWLGPKFYISLLAICCFWVLGYWSTGFYKDVYRRSRLKELLVTFQASLVGSIIVFFALILDDWVISYTDYYRGFVVYFSAHVLSTAFFRMLISSRTAVRIKKGKIWFNTILIGSNANAAELYNEMSASKRKSNGNKFIGFVSVHNNIRFLVEKNLKHLGTHKELESIIAQENIEEVIIAIESSEHEKLEEIINLLEGTPVTIKIIPDTYDIISGKVKLSSLGAPLIEIKHELMPLWQKVIKRLTDIFASALILILLSPLLIFSAIMVKLSSPGPIFFTQKRMGHRGKPFEIIKFRSMYQDAEKDGPQLSSEEDKRITKWGKIMRKYRIDEIPQFLNVILGQMAIVGPRPERQYYIDLIMKKAPYYKHILKVKPGITSWGMVKFGYAQNVDEMVQRLKYDVIYIENMNLFNDIKVLIYTVLIVLQGRGK